MANSVASRTIFNHVCISHCCVVNFLCDEFSTSAFSTYAFAQIFHILFFILFTGRIFHIRLTLKFSVTLVWLTRCVANLSCGKSSVANSVACRTVFGHVCISHCCVANFLCDEFFTSALLQTFVRHLRSNSRSHSYVSPVVWRIFHVAKPEDSPYGGFATEDSPHRRFATQRMRPPA